ncbi:MAG TPA: DUF4349 domain-containing protein [Actinomycetota bacterium]|nr:DUF4349 domain-containing protein [Actinomycetota bacterium]
MATTIEYLNAVHGDLLDAARREAQAGRRSPARWAPSTGMVAAAVSVLVAAGFIGLIVRSGGFGSDEAGSLPAGGSTGATGATGAIAGRPSGIVPGPVHDQTIPGQGPPAVSRVIRTAELSVVIARDAFDKRFGEAVDVAEDQGGFVADSRSRNRSGSLTVRVPAANFDETFHALRALGTVEVESVHGRDVTADYVDLRANLRIARARREVLLGLMADAVSIEQTIRVQNALDETQLRIEQLQGQLRLLDDRTSLATIALRLREEGVEPESEVEKASIPNAFERAAAGFIGVIAVIVIGLGYLIPILVLGLLVWFVVIRVQRRRPA